MPEPTSAGQNVRESTKCTSNCHTQLEHCLVLNKITSSTICLKEITPPTITCSAKDTLEHGAFIIKFDYISSHHVLVFLLFTLNK